MTDPNDNHENEAGAASSDAPLTEDHQKEIVAAFERSKKIRRAARVAGFNGWVTGFFAICSALSAYFSLAGIPVAICLGIVTFNEFRGRRRLLQFDTKAPSLLGWNQVGFLSMIIIYCCWMLYSSLTGENEITKIFNTNPELSKMLNEEELISIMRIAIISIYGSVIVLSIIFQGLNALYYFSIRKHVERFVAETPAWVITLQKLTPKK